MHYPGRRLQRPWQPQTPIQFNPVEHPQPQQSEPDSDPMSVDDTDSEDPLDIMLDESEEELLADAGGDCYLTFEEAHEYMVEHSEKALNTNSA